MLAIRDTMRLIPNDVCTVNMGMAYSAGQFLLSAGTPGRRYSLPHARVLLHQGSAGFGGYGGGHRHPGRGPAPHPGHRARPDRRGHRPSRGAVERDSRRDRWFTAERGVDVRLRRPVVGSLERSARRQPRCIGLAGQGDELLHDPLRHDRRPAAASAPSTSTAGCSPTAIIYLGTAHRRRGGQRGDRAAAPPGVGEPRRPDQPLHQLPGGSIPAMLAVYDAMQFVRAPVETTCVGQAARPPPCCSPGARPGERQILRHGRVVLHQPAAEGRGTIPDLILEAEEVERVRLAAGGAARPAHRSHRGAGARGHRSRPRHDGRDRPVVRRRRRGARPARRLSLVRTASQAARQTGPDLSARVSSARDAMSTVRSPRAPDDGGQDLGRGVLESALDLGEVLRRDARPARPRRRGARAASRASAERCPPARATTGRADGPARRPRLGNSTTSPMPPT